MGMINWAPSNSDKPTVTPYVWVYWTVAVPLTIVVIIVWRIWWKIEDAKHQQQLSKAMKDYDKKKSLFGNLQKQSSADGGLSEIAQEHSNTIDLMKTCTGNLAGHFKRRKKPHGQAACTEIPEC